MAFVFTQDVPITAEMHDLLRAELGEAVPKGLVAHVATTVEGGGLHYIDIWQSRDDFERFRDERLHPALGRFFTRVGFTPPAGEPPMRELDVVDLWAPNTV